MSKRPTVASLHKKLQPIFNHFIRLRDTQVVLPFVLGETREPGTRWGTCISCSKELPYEQLQAGHFVPVASCYYLRYDEDNVNAQCAGCNKWRHGNPFGYMIGLAIKIGQYEVFELVKSRTKSRQYTVELLTEAIEYYEKKVEEME